MTSPIQRLRLGKTQLPPIVRSRVMWAALSALVAGACTQGDHPVGPVAPADTITTTPQLVTEHRITPDKTDPAIDVALDEHIVLAPRSRESNGKLFLYLASSRAAPATALVVQHEAAEIGFHVIGLAYPNNPGLASFCPTSSDPEGCYENVRLQIITGTPQTSFVSVNLANSIDNRLVKLLKYLTTTYPDENWDRFLSGNGTPRWNLIAVGGHSQGAGHAAMIAKLRLVDRVIMLSGITDGVASNAARWVVIGATPVDRYYALAHKRDAQFLPYQTANWSALGLDAFGGVITPETETNLSSYDGTHRFVTDIMPRTGTYVAPAPHASTGVDFATPLDVSGVPILRPVWRYMLTHSVKIRPIPEPGNYP